jgi:hypothetical protein
MPERLIDTVLSRLDRLERANRRLTRALVTVLVGVAALTLMGQAQRSGSKVVEAEQFAILDAGGKVRAALGVAPDGAPNLTFFDDAGWPRVRLGLTRSGSGPRLALLDTNGANRVEIALSADDGPEGAGLTVRDRKGTRRADVIVWADGQAGFSVTDAGGKVRALLVVGTDGSPELTLADRHENIRTQVSATPAGPAVRLYGANRTERARLAVAEVAGEPHVALYDEHHKLRAVFEATRVVLGKDLRGKAERVLWSAP